MRCFLLVEAPDLAAAVRADLEGLGCSPVDDATRAEMIIADSALEDVERRVHAAARTARHVEVLLLVDPGDQDELFEAVTDVVLKPFEAGTLAAQVRMIGRRRARRSTREELLALAVEAAGDIVEITSPNTVLQYVNPAFEKTLGYSREDAIGLTPAKLFRSQMHEPEYFREIDRTLQSGKSWQGLLISRARDGRLVHLESTVAPVIAEDGTITHHVAVKRDITHRVAAEAELRATNEALSQARDAALEASRVKSQFLANMSHELRTPLNAIIGYSEMLAEEAEDLGEDAFVSDLGKIRSAGAHLLALINDVLDLSKIEAGHMELFLEKFGLAALVEGCVSTIQPMAGERGNQVVVEGSLDFDEVKSDVTKLRQTLLNLLSNANKFTESGQIVVRLCTDAPDDPRARAHGGEWFAIEVVDTGIGMTAEEQSRLFKPFVQADASTTRKYGGTGLGLTISQRFCEMMGGRISVKSEPGRGSTFTIHLPRVVDSHPGVPRSVRPEGAQHTVLVVDDDRTTHDLLIRSLGQAGFRVECEDNGVSGLARAKEILPDVIVLDVLMPGLDGWAVLSALKQDEKTQDIPVIMLSIVEQSGGGITLGAADYVVKPVNPKHLVRIVRSHCEDFEANVLIVEDDPPTREVMRRTLTAVGHTVREAENGRVALEALETERPDLIVLDLLMPEVDGFMFLDRIQADPRFRGIPVVVATAKVLTAEERERLTSATHRVIEKNAWTRRELMQVVTRRVAEVLATSGGGPRSSSMSDPTP